MVFVPRNPRSIRGEANSFAGLCTPDRRFFLTPSFARPAHAIATQHAQQCNAPKVTEIVVKTLRQHRRICALDFAAVMYF